MQNLEKKIRFRWVGDYSDNTPFLDLLSIELNWEDLFFELLVMRIYAKFKYKLIPFCI